MHKKKKGQSTLEYITIFVAIVAAIVAFAYTALRPATQNILNAAAGKISNAAATFNAANLNE